MFYTSGCVRQQKRDKAWYAVLRYKDETGKWRQTTKRLPARNKTEAKRQLAEWRADMERSHDLRAPSPSAVPAVEYAYRYIDYKARLRAIQPSTERDYRGAIAAWSRYLGETPIGSVTREQVECVLMSMLDAGLSAATVTKRRIALSMVLDYAVERGDAAANVTLGIPRPKRERPRQNALSLPVLADVKARLDALPLDWWVLGAALCLYAGLRAEEACALQVGDIDLASRTGWVRRAIGHGKGGSYVAPPKNGKPRDFRIPDKLAGYLAEWMERLPTEPAAWLLPYRDAYRDSHWLGKKWSMLCDIEGWKGSAGRKPTLHDLRHTYATRCIAAGMDVKTLQALLGHSSAAVTLDIYAQSTPEGKDGALSVINSAI